MSSAGITGGPVGGKLTVGRSVTGARVLVVGVTEGDKVGAVGLYVGKSVGFAVGSLVGIIVISEALHPIPPFAVVHLSCPTQKQLQAPALTIANKPAWTCIIGTVGFKGAIILRQHPTFTAKFAIARIVLGDGICGREQRGNLWLLCLRLQVSNVTLHDAPMA